MQLNIHNEHEHASTSLKVLLLIFAIVLIAALSYLVWLQSNEPAEDNDTTVIPRNQTDKSLTAVACGNEAYAFSLTFDNDWSGYKIKEVKPDYALVTCYFTMPTNSLEEPWILASDDRDAGYASIFAISVYTLAQWVAAMEEPNAPTELSSNESYVWAWSPAQALPQDLQDSGIANGVTTVIATFKVVQ